MIKTIRLFISLLTVVRQKVQFWLRPFEFSCPPNACVGLFQLIQFAPTALNDQYDWITSKLPPLCLNGVCVCVWDGLVTCPVIDGMDSCTPPL